MNKSKGFTLIELIVVMVILAILAAMAVPKFVDLQSDARIARLHGWKGALASANSLFRSQVIARNLPMTGVPLPGVNTDFWTFSGSNLIYCGPGSTATECNGKDKNRDYFLLQFGYMAITQDKTRIPALVHGLGETLETIRQYQNDQWKTEICDTQGKKACYMPNRRENAYVLFDGQSVSDNCYLNYIPPKNANDSPIYEIVTEGC